MSRRALIVLVLTASTAHASPWDASFAYGGDVETIGGDAYGGMMLQIGLARRLLPRLSASATAELAGVSSDDIEGAIVRGLVGVDFDLVRAAKDFSPNVIVMFGSGTETVMWDRGTLTRPLSYVGAELRLRFGIGHSEFFRHISSMGWRFGVRAHVAPGTSSQSVAQRCTACMDIAPADPSIDAGVVIYMGLLFGR